MEINPPDQDSVDISSPELVAQLLQRQKVGGNRKLIQSCPLISFLLMFISPPPVLLLLTKINVILTTTDTRSLFTKCCLMS